MKETVDLNGIIFLAAFIVVAVVSFKIHNNLTLKNLFKSLFSEMF